MPSLTLTCIDMDNNREIRIKVNGDDAGDNQIIIHRSAGKGGSWVMTAKQLGVDNEPICPAKHNENQAVNAALSAMYRKRSELNAAIRSLNVEAGNRMCDVIKEMLG